MNKQAVIDYFGSRALVAEAVDITSQAVGDWPDVLPRRIADRVIAAMVRQGKPVPEWALQPNPAQAA